MSTIEGRIMSEREKLADRGEPLFSCSRSVRQDGSRENCFTHNIPREAVSLLDIEESDSVLIEIYQDGYVVRRDPDK